MSDILRARMESHIHGARRIRFGIIVVIMSLRLVAAWEKTSGAMPTGK